MKSLLFSALFFSLLFSQAQPVLIPREVTDDISMKVPLKLRQEPPTLQRSQSANLANFVSDDLRSDLSVNRSKLRWIQADEVLLSQFYKANILNIYDQVVMIQEEIRAINGRKFIIFEFSGQIVDEPNAFKAAKRRSDYTYIQYAIVSDGILIFRFTSSAQMTNHWKEAIREAMNSVEIEEEKR